MLIESPDVKVDSFSVHHSLSKIADKLFLSHTNIVYCRLLMKILMYQDPFELLCE
jgi:hypothetical protein